jgi:hypothetical protein
MSLEKRKKGGSLDVLNAHQERADNVQRSVGEDWG